MPDGKIVIETSLETKSFDAQIKELENKLEIMTKTLETENQIDVKLRMSDDERLKLESDIEKTKNKIISLKQAMGKAEDSGNKMNNNLSKGFEKGSESLKRFALSLFSVGSIFAAVSKASSAYLSENEELANKLQSVWVGLGSFMEPVLTMISDALLKALGYLNVFVKALTGVDYIARANAKALEKQAKSQKKLNKETQQYDFDVIRTQQDNKTSKSNELPSGYINIPELDDKLVAKLQNLAKWLKENEKLIKAVGIALGITFGAIAIGKLLKNIAKIIGSAGAGTGIAGLGTALLAIAAVFTVTLAIKGAIEVKKQIDELNASLEKNTEAAKGNRDTQENLSKSFWNLVKSGKATNEQKQSMINYTDKETKLIVNQIKQLENQKTWLGEITGSNKKLTDQQVILLQQLNLINDDYKNLYEQGLLTDEQKETYIESLKTEIEELGKLGLKNDSLIKQYENLTKKPYTIEINAKDNTKNVIDLIKERFRSILGGGKGSFGYSSSGGGGFRGYATGGIITQPTRALIGEAGYPEYVLPEREDYLSRLANLIGQYGGSGRNTTNVYLNGRLIQREISKTQDRLNFATNK